MESRASQAPTYREVPNHGLGSGAYTRVIEDTTWLAYLSLRYDTQIYDCNSYLTGAIIYSDLR